jgi:hypothetical protein
MADFATNSSTVDELDCATAVQSFEQDGFVAIPSLHSPQHIDSLCAVALENFETCIRTIEANGHSLGIGVKEGFKEIVQRHLNRFEMTFRMDQTPFLNLHKNETIMSFVHGILGPQASLVSTSILVSLPGTQVCNCAICNYWFVEYLMIWLCIIQFVAPLLLQDQGWHTDGPHMDIAKHLPCHCLNVFMPLVDISRENGPTEFRPGSHYMTRDLAKQYLAAFVSKRIRPIQSPCPKRGDAVAVGQRFASCIPVYVYLHRYL